jgi:hypothetical protein
VLENKVRLKYGCTPSLTPYCPKTLEAGGSLEKRKKEKRTAAALATMEEIRT